MKKLDIRDASRYVEEHIGEFHKKRVESIEKLQLKEILARKNPYLFKAKYMQTADRIVRVLTDAHISSHEETIFGNWLEEFAIFINRCVYGGRKSGISGIDLEFDADETRYIVSIKSVPNWGNGSQWNKMKQDFTSAKKTLRTGNSRLNVVAVNGCCYGKSRNPDKGEYYKYCGQVFWKFISNDDELFTKIIEPLGYKAKENNDQFMESYSRMINMFIRDFSNDFCQEDGAIDWHKLVMFNSATRVRRGSRSK